MVNACAKSNDDKVVDKALSTLLDMLHVYKDKVLHALVDSYSLKESKSKRLYDFDMYDESFVIQLLLYVHNKRTPQHVRIAADRALRYIAAHLNQAVVVRIFESVVFGDFVKSLKTTASEYLTIATYRLL